ncbi:hypothetical protein SLEP1_g23823 [Rubroshorea leprosula]|uniref:RRM domain-containing protein n=1 Tax=Rubroshorea leprosula TaxID=152421 RepID=A0AAV5JPK3_9ROSI|nr:hypothetical protein SLEP1_g23823 [Rubroshorea leprosula]
MPPRVVKRGAAAAGQRRMSRGTRGASKVQYQQPDAAEEVVKVASVPPVKVREEEEEAEEDGVKVQGKPIIEEETQLKLDLNGLPDTKSNEMKGSVDEYEKDERLELDDNDPDYEPEEYPGVDYDEKETDAEEVGDEVEEDQPDEEHDVDEKEVGLSEDEDVPEGESVDDDDDHAAEEVEHADLADAAEHEERHEVVQERRKRKEFELFVGGLDKDATEDDIRKVFSQVGELVEVRLMRNPQTKKNKGFAFLRFATVEQAKRAVTELRNPVINGKQCGVTPSQDSDTLFLGNICKTWTKEALKEKLKHYGVENVQDITLVGDTNNEGKNRGFAFLEFSSRSDAMDAFKRLQRRDVLFGVDRPAKVSFADSFIDPGDEIMSQVRTIFVDCLPPSWDEDRVQELLKKYGEIEKIELARNMPSADRKDYGFVTFDTHDAAVTCAKSINNTELGEGNNKAKVRARLSRPRHRGRTKPTGRDNFRSARGSGRVVRGSWGHPAPHGYPTRGVRGVGNHVPPPIAKRPVGLRDSRMRDRQPMMSVPARGRGLALPPRSYDRRAPVPSFQKSSLNRDHGRRDELPPTRSRAPMDYGARVISERRPSYREEFSSRSTAYSDLPRSSSRTAARRPYVDDGYGQRLERPPPSYHEGRDRDYDSISGAKRPYSAMDDIPPRYPDMSVRHSRTRLDYELAGPPPQYGDAYGDRLGRSPLGYVGSRSSMSSQDSHGFYGGRQGMGYGGSSFGGDVGRMYSSSSYGGDYVPRGSDVGTSSYSTLYSSRSMGGSGYMGGGGGGGGGGSGSYY